MPKRDRIQPVLCKKRPPMRLEVQAQPGDRQRRAACRHPDRHLTQRIAAVLRLGKDAEVLAEPMLVARAEVEAVEVDGAGKAVAIERPNMAIGGITPLQRLAMAAWLHLGATGDSSTATAGRRSASPWAPTRK